MLPIVDIHAHYVSTDANSRENFRRLVDSPEVHRVVTCALDLKLPDDPDFPFMSQFCATSNEQLAAFIEEIASPKLVPFCYVDPREKDAPKELEHWINSEGMSGLKLYPPQGWYPDEPRVLPTFQAAEALGIPVLIHMGRVASHPQLRSKYARPICLEDVGLACPRLKLIIGHFAAPWYREAIHIGMSFPEWRFDLTTSGSWYPEAFGLLQRMHEEWGDPGLKRLVLGTDGSGARNLEIARATLARLKAQGLSDDQLDMIAHRNGMALLGDRDEK